MNLEQIISYIRKSEIWIITYDRMGVFSAKHYSENLTFDAITGTVNVFILTARIGDNFIMCENEHSYDAVFNFITKAQKVMNIEANYDLLETWSEIVKFNIKKEG